MDTFITFINGGYPGRKDTTENTDQQPTNEYPNVAINAVNDFKTNNTNSNTPRMSSNDIMMNDMDLDAQVFEDDVLNEFLNPQCFQQTNSDLTDFIHTSENRAGQQPVEIENQADSNIDAESPMDNMTVLPEGELSPNTVNLAEEIKRYEESKQELMKVSFGLNKDSKYIHHSSIGFCYTRAPSLTNPDDPEVTTTILPNKYQEAYLKSSNDFPYKLKLEDLPSHSRVETQIKLELSVSPPPPQFLLHIPRDSITKPKFTLADNSIPESLKDHLLYLDIFVVGSDSLNKKDGKLKSCNVCKRCMRRELKRASRRKAGLVDDSSNWDIRLSKRAIIINSKEIVSFPAPNGSNEKKIELLSRIVCYCRHHQELDGFRIVIFLKDGNGQIVGKVNSTPILIMDRKKSVKSSTNLLEKKKESNSASENLKQSPTPESSSELSIARSVSTATTNPILSESKNNLTNDISNLNAMNIISSSNRDTSASDSSNKNNNTQKKSQMGMFSSLFSFDPSNILGDENSRHIKRQKRPWAQTEAATYFESINQQRGIPSSNNNEMNIVGMTKSNDSSRNNKISIKKEAVSPLSSDAISPQHHLHSSATSVFSLTPERKLYEQHSTTNKNGDNNNSLTDFTNNEIMMNIDDSSSSAVLDIASSVNIDIDNLTNINTNINQPVVTRIIPAQGPTRGGIEITLLGSNFRPGLIVKFGSNISLATQCWSDSTIVTYLPPASQAGPVLVTFEDPSLNLSNASSHQIFTYTDDTDRQLIELALQIVGLKMNGKLEDAKNIAKRIVGNNQIDTQTSPSQSTSTSSSTLNQQLQLNWMAVASNKIKELSKSSLNREEILIKFLSMMKSPNSFIPSLNWGICNSEGQTMLHLAIFKNYNKLSYFLIKNGSRVDYKDKNGFTPIHFAFINGNRKSINLLNKFNANCSNKLDNGVLLSEISDSNVLDLINDGKKNNERIRRPSNSSTDLEFDELDVEVNSFGEDIDVDYNYGYDYYQISYRSNKNKNNSKESRSKKSVKVGSSFDDDYAKYEGYDEYEDDDEFDSELDNEDETIPKSAGSNKGLLKLNNDEKDNNPFGYNLWIAMKEAIKNRMNEISESQNKKHHISKKRSNRESEVYNESDIDEDVLPSYDDLFPHGSSLRSLFRGHGGEKDEDVDDYAMKNNVINENMICTGQDEDKDSDVDLIAMNLRTSINSDTKLLFFWLPCMLLLLLMVIGTNLNMIKIENMQYFSLFLEKVRETVGSFTLGRDRFTNLINENINYGRERMENLINDVNGAVLTAVAGVAR